MTTTENFAKMGHMRRVLICWAILAAVFSPAAFADDPADVMLLIEPAQPEGAPTPQGTRWKPVSAQSARFLSFQHIYRIALQAKTRQYLGGNFFKDYGDSLKGLGGWKDGDSLYTNYVLHPIQGATTGFVFIHNNPKGRDAPFGSRDYWRSRLKAWGFAAIYSTQFELGPLSEASIGNVGKARGTMGFVDLVITPIGGFGWMLAEDALDHFLVVRLEQKWQRTGLIRFVRVALNPARSFANVMRLRLPWYRPGRELNKMLPKDPMDEDPPIEALPAGFQPDEQGADFLDAANIVIFVPA